MDGMKKMTPMKMPMKPLTPAIAAKIRAKAGKAMSK